MSREAMKQALEALEQINDLSKGENAIALPGEIDGAMDALRAALDAPESDLVVLMDAPLLLNGQPLYTRPQREWRALTTQEILDIVDDHTERVGGLPMLYRDQAVALARNIEAKLKEKNA